MISPLFRLTFQPKTEDLDNAIALLEKLRNQYPEQVGQAVRTLKEIKNNASRN